MFATAEKTTRHSQILQQQTVATAFLHRKAEDSFLSPKQQDSFISPVSSASGFIQPKLSISQPDDPQEKEADEMAERVMTMPEPAVSQITPGVEKEEIQPELEEEKEEKVQTKAEGSLYRKCEKCEEEEKLQPKRHTTSNYRKAEATTPTGGTQLSAGVVAGAVNFTLQRQGRSPPGSVTTAFEQTLRSTKGAGSPLAGTALQFMESRFGADFHRVRIHTGSAAAQLNREIHAQAFTHGNDIYFNAGKFSPHSAEGGALLAHELTHTIHQNGIHRKSIQQQPACKTCHSRASVAQQQPHAAVQPVAAPAIQKKEEEDNAVVKTIKDTFWSTIKEVSPEVHDIFRYKGFTTWAKEKLTSFVTSTIQTLVAPVKVGAAIISKVKTNFTLFSTWLQAAAIRIKSGDCTPFAEASEFITNILEGLADPALEKLKAFLIPIKNFIDKVWNDFGKPLWDFISKVYGTIWDTIKRIAEKVWSYVKTIIDFYADIWHWFLRTVGFEGDDPNSFWEQIKKKVLSLWEAIKQKLEPYKTQLMVVAGAIALLSPAGPFLISAAVIGGIMFAASKIRHYLKDNQAIMQERGYVQGILVPNLLNALHQVSAFLKVKATSISNALKNAVKALHAISQDVGDTLLAALNAAVDWVTEKIEALDNWAELQLVSLVGKLEDIFNGVKNFLKPVADILGLVGQVLASYYRLPFLVLNKLFHIIPACIRKKIIAFLTKYVFKHIPILREITDVEAAWVKMEKKAMQVIDRIFKHGDLLGGLWEIFNLLLDAMKVPKELALKVQDKAFDVFDQIVEKPKVFFTNMLQTIKMGLAGFFERKWTHLKNGFTKWLFGAIGGRGIHIPQALSFPEIFKMFSSLFGMLLERVYQRMTKNPRIGPEKVSLIRKVMGYITKGATTAWNWLKLLHENNVEGVIEKIKEKGAELWEMASDAIINWIVEKVIEKVTIKIISMLDPSGIMPVINSIIAFYKAVETALEKAREILTLIESVLDNLTQILAGALEKSAVSLEKNLATALPLILEFLSNQLSMGKLGKKIKEMARKADEWINEKIDWLIEKGLAFIDQLLNLGKQAIGKVKGWLGLRRDFKEKNGKEHQLYFVSKGEKGVLTLASNPAAYSDFLQGLTIPSDDKVLSGKKTYARQLLQQVVQLSDVAATTGVDKRAEIDTRLGTIAEITADLMQAQVPVGKSFVPVYAGLINGYAGGMRLEFLSGKNPSGSSPNVSGHERFNKLNQRRTGSNDASFYVLGHLLNEQLGGPGNTWQNLTPLSRSANSAHERNVEIRLKPYLSRGKTFIYVVLPNYGRSLNTTLLDSIDNTTDTPVVKQKKREVVEAERFVPVSLTCTIREIDPVSREEVPSDHSTTYTVANNIEQTSPDVYQV